MKMKKLLAFISIIMIALNCLTVVNYATEEPEESVSQYVDIRDKNSGMALLLNKGGVNKYWPENIELYSTREKLPKAIKGRIEISDIQGVSVYSTTAKSKDPYAFDGRSLECCSPVINFDSDTMEFSVNYNLDENLPDYPYWYVNLEFLLATTADAEYIDDSQCGKIKFEITEITTQDDRIITNTDSADGYYCENDLKFGNDWWLEQGLGYKNFSGDIYRGFDIEKVFKFSCVPRIAGAQGHIVLSGVEGVTIDDVEIIGKEVYNSGKYDFEDEKEAEITEFNEDNGKFVLELKDEKIGQGLEDYAVISVKLHVDENAVVDEENAKLQLVFDSFSDALGKKISNCKRF